MGLNDLMIKYGTDKQEELHNYVKYYDKYFSNIKNQKLKILEIGIYRPPIDGKAVVAASLKTWRDYFINSNIIGVDLDDFSDVDDDRITTMKVNQELRYTNGIHNGLYNIIEKFGDNFDIIIDDGGHTMLQQQVTLGFMFKFLKPGGLFIIEDLHTSYFAPFAYNNTNTQYTTLGMLENYLRNKTIMSDFITDDENKYLLSKINRLEIYKGNESEIAFITKNE
jgi:hypothetical protein